MPPVGGNRWAASSGEQCPPGPVGRRDLARHAPWRDRRDLDVEARPNRFVHELASDLLGDGGRIGVGRVHHHALALDVVDDEPGAGRASDAPEQQPRTFGERWSQIADKVDRGEHLDHGRAVHGDVGVASHLARGAVAGEYVARDDRPSLARLSVEHGGCHLTIALSGRQPLLTKGDGSPSVLR